MLLVHTNINNFDINLTFLSSLGLHFGDTPVPTLWEKKSQKIQDFVPLSFPSLNPFKGFLIALAL